MTFSARIEMEHWSEMGYSDIPAANYIIRVNHRNTNGVALVSLLLSFEHISNLVLVGVSIVNFEQINAGWDLIGYALH